MVELIDKESSSVLSHCSDGYCQIIGLTVKRWDRTSQVCAVAEMCLDPNYRTIAGFAIIIEKEFLAFGHKMAQVFIYFYLHLISYQRVGHDENMDNYKDKERAPIFLQVIRTKQEPNLLVC